MTRSRFNFDMVKWLVASASLVWLACSDRPNPDYCDENADCKNGFSCNLSTHGCEETMVADDAGIDSPGSCALDDECSSGVCKLDGSCELAENVLYVATNGVSAGMCPSDAPCDLSFALMHTDAERRTIRLASGSYPLSGAITVDELIGEGLVVVGPRSAVVSRESDGVAFDIAGVNGSAHPDVTLRGFTLQKGVGCRNGTVHLTRVLFADPPAEARAWIDGAFCAIEINQSELRHARTEAVYLSNGELHVDESIVAESEGNGIRIESASGDVARSEITKNIGTGFSAFGSDVTLDRNKITLNEKGGVSSIQGRFRITNNIVYRNGSDGGLHGSSTFGGLRLEGTAGSQLLHNTIVRNDCSPASTPALAGGVYCTNAATLNNIIANNFRGSADQPDAQVAGSCSFTGSLLSNDASTIGFLDDIGGDLHIGTASTAKNTGQSSDVIVDFDGEPRNDGLPDLGADEVH